MRSLLFCVALEVAEPKMFNGHKNFQSQPVISKFTNVNEFTVIDSNNQ